MTHADLLARCVKAHAAMLDVLDLPRTLTMRQVADHEQRRRDLAACISTFNNADGDLAPPTAKLADLEERRAAVLQKEQELLQQIADAPSISEINDARLRDKEDERQRQLAWQLQRLRNGTLLASPGICWPRVTELDERIAALQHEIASIRSRLDYYTQQAERLLADVVAEKV